MNPEPVVDDRPKVNGHLVRRTQPTVEELLRVREFAFKDTPEEKAACFFSLMWKGVELRHPRLKMMVIEDMVKVLRTKKRGYMWLSHVW